MENFGPAYDLAEEHYNDFITEQPFRKPTSKHIYSACDENEHVSSDLSIGKMDCLCRWQIMCTGLEDAEHFGVDPLVVNLHVKGISHAV